MEGDLDAITKGIIPFIANGWLFQESAWPLCCRELVQDGHDAPASTGTAIFTAPTRTCAATLSRPFVRMNRTKETENNNKPETKMLKKIATLIALGLLVTGNAAAYTHTYSRTVTNGQYFTQGYSVSAPSAVSFNRVLKNSAASLNVKSEYASK